MSKSFLYEPIGSRSRNDSRNNLFNFCFSKTKNQSSLASGRGSTAFKRSNSDNDDGGDNIDNASVVSVATSRVKRSSGLKSFETKRKKVIRREENDKDENKSSPVVASSSISSLNYNEMMKRRRCYTIESSSEVDLVIPLSSHVNKTRKVLKKRSDTATSREKLNEIIEEMPPHLSSPSSRKRNMKKSVGRKMSSSEDDLVIPLSSPVNKTRKVLKKRFDTAASRENLNEIIEEMPPPLSSPSSRKRNMKKSVGRKMSSSEDDLVIPLSSVKKTRKVLKKRCDTAASRENLNEIIEEMPPPLSSPSSRKRNMKKSVGRKMSSSEDDLVIPLPSPVKKSGFLKSKNRSRSASRRGSTAFKRSDNDDGGDIIDNATSFVSVASSSVKGSGLKSFETKRKKVIRREENDKDENKSSPVVASSSISSLGFNERMRHRRCYVIESSSEDDLPSPVKKTEKVLKKRSDTATSRENLNEMIDEMSPHLSSSSPRKRNMKKKSVERKMSSTHQHNNNNNHSNSNSDNELNLEKSHNSSVYSPRTWSKPMPLSKKKQYIAKLISLSKAKGRLSSRSLETRMLKTDQDPEKESVVEIESDVEELEQKSPATLTSSMYPPCYIILERIKVPHKDTKTKTREEDEVVLLVQPKVEEVENEPPELVELDDLENTALSEPLATAQKGHLPEKKAVPVPNLKRTFTTGPEICKEVFTAISDGVPVSVDDAVSSGSGFKVEIDFEAEYVVEENRVGEYLKLQNSSKTNSCNKLTVNNEDFTKLCAQQMEPIFGPGDQEYPGVQVKMSPWTDKYSMGYMALAPKTVLPFEVYPDRDTTYTIIKGKITVKSTGTFVRRPGNTKNYMFGKEFGVGATILMRKNTLYTLENWDKEDALLYCTMIKD